jgi:two-component system, chemotaxis family, protein-glutamate methylesterase/glutaminase
VSVADQTLSAAFPLSVGHGYTAEALAHEQEGSVDEAFRIATQVIGDRTVLMEKALDAHQAGRSAAAGTFEDRAREYRGHAAILTEAALQR